MKALRSFLYRFSTIGLDKQDSYIQQKETVISNKISLFLMPFIFLGLFLSFQRGVYFSALGFGMVLLLLLAIFSLNKFGKSVIARFSLSILLSLLLLIPNVLGGVGKEENYLVFSYIFIGFSIIPILLFQDKKDTGLLILALFINLLTIMFFDVLMVWSETSNIDISLIEENYTYYKLPQIILWVIMVASCQFIKNESNSYREKLESSNKSLRESNQQIRKKSEEILVHKLEISEQKLNFEVQNTKLITSNNELKNTKLELLNVIEKLKDARDKIMQQKAEAKSVFNALNEHYLVAQYNLDGQLVSINTKVIELLGILKNEHFENIRPLINKSSKNQGKSQNGKYFTKVWERVLEGEAQTIELEFDIGDNTKTLATTFTPLLDDRNNAIRILAIGRDVSELIAKDQEIDKINDELKEKIYEISKQNELLNFQQSQIFEYSEELHKQKERIQPINK